MSHGASYHSPHKFMFQHQLDRSLDQANPVMNTWYPVLPTTRNCRLISSMMAVMTTAEDLAMRIITSTGTISGTRAAAVAGSYYDSYLGDDVAEKLWFTAAGIINSQFRPFMLEGQSIQVDIRKTTNVGNGNLRCIVKWAVLLPA